MQNPYPKDYGIKLSHAVWTKEITWHDIKIKILFNESGCGYPIMEHIEIRTENKQKLPITDTGYLSHFVPWTIIEPYGDAVGFIKAWLDDASTKKSWQKHVKNSRQLTLF